MKAEVVGMLDTAPRRGRPVAPVVLAVAMEAMTGTARYVEPVRVAMDRPEMMARMERQEPRPVRSPPIRCWSSASLGEWHIRGLPDSTETPATLVEVAEAVGEVEATFTAFRAKHTPVGVGVPEVPVAVVVRGAKAAGRPADQLVFWCGIRR